MILQRKRLGAKDKFPATLALLVINRPSARLSVRYLSDGVFAALLFAEHLLELPVDRLASFGLTPRETEVLRWLAQGKTSVEA
jgi:DNA-binding NarL/FixJ family response regulator